MKHLVIYMLICLSALFNFGYCSPICFSKNNNSEIAINSINKKEILKEYVTKNIDRLYRLAFSYSKTEQYAEDIVNESVVRALAAIDTLRNEEYIGTWMYRIVINTANTYLKKQAKIIYLDDTMIEDGLLDKYRDVDLYKEIMRLEDKYRIIIVLRFFEDQ